MWYPSLKTPLSAQAQSESFPDLPRVQAMYQWANLALCLRRDRWDEKSLRHGLRFFKELILELRATPPLGLCLDLWAMIRQGEQFSPRELEAQDTPFRRLLQRTQHELYFRLLSSPAFLRLSRLVRGLPEAPPSKQEANPLHLQDRACVYLIAQLLKPVQEHLLDSFRPHPLPKFSKANAPAWWTQPLCAVEAFELSIGHPHWIASHHQLLLDRLLRLSEGQWVHEEWLPMIAHFDQLQNKLDRLRWQSMAEAETQIAKPSHTIELLRLRDQGYQQIRLQSRSMVPEGGICGISQRGHLESLLPSELLFWEPNAAVDLFALRWLERELLFYERDRQVSHTFRRRLRIFLDISLGDVGYRSPGWPASSASLLFGMLARLTADLRQICPDEVLQIDYCLGPAKIWDTESRSYALFLSHVVGIGGSTTFTLCDDIAESLAATVAKPGDLHLLVTSAQNAVAHEADARPALTFAVEWLSSTQDLPTSLLQAHENGTSHAGLWFKHEMSQELLLKSTSSSATQQMNFTPDVYVVLEGSSSLWETLAQLRDTVLEWILRVFPTSYESTSKSRPNL